MKYQEMLEAVGLAYVATEDPIRCELLTQMWIILRALMALDAMKTGAADQESA